MVINKKICSAGLKNNPNKALKSPDFITIHCTGNYNATATAKSHADYQFNGSGGSQISWHYTVDKNEIWQSFEDTRSCWHTGNADGNAASIGIEICVNEKLGFKAACINAAWLTAELLKRHKLTIDKVVQHHKWSGKNCPAELRNGAWGVTWDGFIEMVRANLQPVTSPTVPLPEPSVWAKESWEWAKINKITDGTNPQSPATREQVAAMIYNYSKK